MINFIDCRRESDGQRIVIRPDRINTVGVHVRGVRGPKTAWKVDSVSVIRVTLDCGSVHDLEGETVDSVLAKMGHAMGAHLLAPVKEA